MHKDFIPHLPAVPVVMGQKWEDVAEPGAWGWSLPFTIQQNGRNFRLKPGFTLQGRANITVTTTYYVDADNGNDGNSGADWDNAFATLNQVQTEGDADRVYVRGTFLKSGAQVIGFSRNTEIISDTGATITSLQTDQLSGWAVEDDHYKDDGIGDYIATVWDASNLDSYGNPTPLTAVGSQAAVDSTPNSFWTDWGNTDLYVHTFDSREPDADILCYDSLTHSPTKDSLTYYFENITFKAGVRLRNASATGGLKAYFKNCTFYQMTIAGVDEIMFDGCTFHSALGDGINIDARNGITSKVVEYNCTVYNCQEDGSTQCSTSHAACETVRIGGTYYDASGQIIADVTNSLSWNLGLYVHTSASADHFYQQGATGKMWVDSCTVVLDGDYDLNSVDGVIYSRNILPAGYTTNGTITPY